MSPILLIWRHDILLLVGDIFGATPLGPGMSRLPLGRLVVTSALEWPRARDRDLARIC